MARSRRDRDVPRELHKRIEQIERDPKHPNARTGKLLDELGFLAVIPPDEQPDAGWGWGATLLSKEIGVLVDAGWGWGDTAVAENIGRAFGAGWGWGEGASAANIVEPFSEGWGWAGKASAIVASDPIGLEADLLPGQNVDAGWGWGENVIGGKVETLSAGWGWGGQVSATQPTNNPSLAVNDSSVNDTAMN